MFLKSVGGGYENFINDVGSLLVSGEFPMCPVLARYLGFMEHQIVLEKGALVYLGVIASNLLLMNELFRKGLIVYHVC